MASAGRALVCGGGAVGSAAVAEEFSTLHLRSSFIDGGIAIVVDFSLNYFLRLKLYEILCSEI